MNSHLMPSTTTAGRHDKLPGASSVETSQTCARNASTYDIREEPDFKGRVENCNESNRLLANAETHTYHNQVSPSILLPLDSVITHASMRQRKKGTFGIKESIIYVHDLDRGRTR